MKWLKLSVKGEIEDTYVSIDSRDKTWRSILDAIESSLDNQYLDNDHKLLGINLSIEIVDKAPEDARTE